MAPFPMTLSDPLT